MTKKRAINIDPKSKIGQDRKDLYASGWKRINEAIKDEYYLEAIALLESIISDRLEARIGILTDQKRTGFISLEGNLRLLFDEKQKCPEAKETDSKAIQLYREIDNWRINRNEALHEMMKLDKEDHVGWEGK